MKMRKLSAMVGAIALAAAGLVTAATPASADQVWYQSFERPSKDATCSPPANETPWQDSFEGQKVWTPSWAEWANGGKGGWVCERYIVWAKEAPGGWSPAVAGCVLGDKGPFDAYLDFRGSYFVEPGTTSYSDSECSIPLSSTTVHFVYTPPGADAVLLCRMASGNPSAAVLFDWGLFKACTV